MDVKLPTRTAMYSILESKSILKKMPTLLGGISLLVPTFVLAVAGFAKLADPYLAARFLAKALSLEFQNSLVAARLVGLCELLLAIALCICWGGSRIPAIIALVLFGMFAGLLASVAVSAPNAASCGCFGSTLGEWIRKSMWAQVYIDIGLMSLLSAFLLFIPNRDSVEMLRRSQV